MFALSKIVSIFAPVHAKNFLVLIGVAIFIATYPAKAANIGSQIPIGCYSMSTMVLGRTGGDCLSSLFNNLNFRSMPRTNENVSTVNSSQKARVAHETSIQTFSFEGTLNLRTLVINGNPYFVAIDVAKALGYYVPKDAVSAHCRKAIKHRLSDNHGIPHDYNVIPESDVYRLIMRSNLPTAERFQDWITSEVLPSIRKEGYYAIQPGGYVTEREVRHLEMMLGMEREQRDYYVKQRDEWQNRAMDRNIMLLELITNS